MTESRADSENDVVSPPWGALPAEQFLIRNWDWESSDSPAIQRLKLIRRFLHLSEVSDELDVLGSHRNEWGSRNGWSPELWPSVDTVVVPRPPTPRELERILKPWRPLALRRRAVDFWMNIVWGCDEAIWLRTSYEPGSDETWEQFLEQEADENPSMDEAYNARFLNDKTCFNLGSNWELLFDLLPEARGYPPARLLAQHIEESRQEIMRLIQSKESRTYGNGYILGWESRVVDQVHFMQFYCYSHYMVVADEEAFTSNKLRLIFFDRMRNIVREGRIPAEEVHMVGTYQLQGRITEQYWAETEEAYCELGEKYLPDGEFGSALYALDDPAATRELWRIMGWQRQSKEEENVSHEGP